MRAKAYLKECWQVRKARWAATALKRTQFGCWRRRAGAIRDIKEQIIVIGLAVEGRAIALRSP